MADSTAQHSERVIIPDFDIADYIAGNGDSDGAQLDMFSDFQQHASPPSQMSMESPVASQNVLGSHNPMEYASHGHPRTAMAEMLKGRLEQQMKLQQLQQLQNHILQQQIELISSQSSMNTQHKDIIFHGLLTPGPSAELHAMVPKDLVSPMMLQQEVYMSNEPSTAAIVNQISPHQHDLSMSAPAALAFQTSPPFPLPSPADDLSPLTSPWLLPVPTQQNQQYSGQNNSDHVQARPPRRKRAVSISGDDQSGMRKRTSSSIHSAGLSGRPGISASTASTSIPPVAANSRGSSGTLIPQSKDSPSPVDLSMPPPAPPVPTSHSSISSSSSSGTLSATSTSVSPNIAPVTPASIMNLGKLPTGLIPSHCNDSSSLNGGSHISPKRAGKNKAVARPKVAVPNSAAARGRRGSVAKPGISPNLKPLLPGAVSAPSSSPLALPTNPGHISSGFGSTSANILPGPRKTSHKAAEQKRRDSLKTSFDELRLLLPPVPLPDDAGDEPPLPGSMPPRGPPKGDADGPNRGVSKLALLRCGNTYIRDLKGQVGRRDAEIERLRAEVRRLRSVVGDPGGPDVDLERDVDEGELPAQSVGCYGEDGDEDVE